MNLSLFLFLRDTVINLRENVFLIKDSNIIYGNFPAISLPGISRNLTGIFLKVYRGVNIFNLGFSNSFLSIDDQHKDYDATYPDRFSNGYSFIDLLMKYS